MVRTIVIAVVLLLLGAEARADTQVVLYSGAGVGGGLQLLRPRGRFLTRVDTGFGFLDEENGSGFLFEAALLSEIGGHAFEDGLRVEGGIRFLTGRGAIRVFGGRLLTNPGFHAGGAYGLPIPIAGRVLLTPELGVTVSKNHEGSIKVLIGLQIIGDWLWGRW